MVGTKVGSSVGVIELYLLGLLVVGRVVDFVG